MHSLKVFLSESYRVVWVFIARSQRFFRPKWKKWPKNDILRWQKFHIMVTTGNISAFYLNFELRNCNCHGDLPKGSSKNHNWTFQSVRVPRWDDIYPKFPSDKIIRDFSIFDKILMKNVQILRINGLYGYWMNLYAFSIIKDTEKHHFKYTGSNYLFVYIHNFSAVTQKWAV